MIKLWNKSFNSWIYINPKHIIAVFKHDNNDFTSVYVSNGVVYQVEESIQIILDLINDNI